MSDSVVNKEMNESKSEVSPTQPSQAIIVSKKENNLEDGVNESKSEVSTSTDTEQQPVVIPSKDQGSSNIGKSTDPLANTITLVDYPNVAGWLQFPSTTSWFFLFTAKKKVFVRLEGFELKKYKDDSDMTVLEQMHLRADTIVKKSAISNKLSTLILKWYLQNKETIKWVFEDHTTAINHWYRELGERIQTLKEAEGDSTSSKNSSTVSSITSSSSSSLTTITSPKSYNIDGTEFLLPSHYKPKRKLGAGAYGVVISAQDTSGDEKKLVGIKKCFSVFNSPLDAKKIAREVHLTKQFKHPNVLSLLTVIPPPSENFDDLYIVSELMDIDLHNLMHQKGGAITPEHIKFFLYQLCCAVHYLHSIDVMHRDIKPSNCLVNSNCDLRLCDYGLARGFLENDTSEFQNDTFSGSDDYSEYVVTRWYRAPEVILNPRKYDKAIDMWSVGCLLAELLGKGPLFPAKNYKNLLYLITKVCGSLSENELDFINDPKAVDGKVVGPKEFMRNLPPTPRKDLTTLFPNTDPLCLDFLSKLLQIDPRKRLTAEQALEHPYFEGYRDEEKEKKGEAKIEWNNLESLTLVNNKKNPKGARQKLNKELRDFILNDIIDMNPESSRLYRNFNRRSSKGN